MFSYSAYILYSFVWLVSSVAPRSPSHSQWAAGTLEEACHKCPIWFPIAFCSVFSQSLSCCQFCFGNFGRFSSWSFEWMRTAFHEPNIGCWNRCCQVSHSVNWKQSNGCISCQRPPCRCSQEWLFCLWSHFYCWEFGVEIHCLFCIVKSALVFPWNLWSCCWGSFW